MEQFISQFVGGQNTVTAELTTFGIVSIAVLTIWALVWKGWALWKAARSNTHYSKYWFIVLLIVNTAGILEILYIFVFSRNKKGKLQNDSDGMIASEGSDTFNQQ